MFSEPLKYFALYLIGWLISDSTWNWIDYVRPYYVLIVHAPICGRSLKSVSTKPELWPRWTAWIGSIRLGYDQLCCWQWAPDIFLLCFFFEMQNNSSQPKNEEFTAQKIRPTFMEKMAMLEKIYAGVSRCAFALAAVSWPINQWSIELSLAEKGSEYSLLKFHQQYFVSWDHITSSDINCQRMISYDP